MARRTIDGPDKDLLTREEVCQYLRVSDRQLRRLIQSGAFPRGVSYGERGPVLWLWEDAAAFRHLRSRLPAGAAEKETSDGDAKQPPEKKS